MTALPWWLLAAEIGFCVLFLWSLLPLDRWLTRRTDQRRVVSAAEYIARTAAERDAQARRMLTTTDEEPTQ